MQTPDTNTKDRSLALAGLITHPETSTDHVMLVSLCQRLRTPDLLDKQQAAEFLTIAVRTLDDWRKAKLIPCIHRSRYIRFRRGDLETFLGTHTLEARKESPSRPSRNPLRRNHTPKRKALLNARVVLRLKRVCHAAWTVFWRLAVRIYFAP